MTSNRIFTRQLLGLDYRVWLVMLIISILSLVLLSYRLIDASQCMPVNFTIKTTSNHTDSTYLIGEKLTFISSTNKDEITWDFGDNSEKITGHEDINHVFLKTGNYKITASTGSACEMVKLITVIKTEAIQKKGSDVVVGEEILGPFSTMTGREEQFFCMVTANAYEWSIPNYPKMTRTGSTAKFTFPSAGKFLIQVTLDHDFTKRFSKEITVEAAPDVQSNLPDDIKPLIPSGVQPLTNLTVKISDETFKGYLEKVIDKKMSAADFDNYLCYKGETKVILNGELITFNALCEDISGKKRRKLLLGRTKIKIKTAEMRRDKDGCVNIIEIKYH